MGLRFGFRDAVRIGVGVGVNVKGRRVAAREGGDNRLASHTDGSVPNSPPLVSDVVEGDLGLGLARNDRVEDFEFVSSWDGELVFEGGGG